jgi:quinol monooxygenase YgiN
MPIYQTARFQIQPQALEKCKQATRDFIDYVRTHEPGTLQYTAMEEKINSANFLYVFVFADDAARDRHANSDAVKHFSGLLYPNTLAPVEFTEYTVVAAK